MPTLNIKSTQQAIKVGEHKGEEMFVMKVEHYNTMDAERIIDYAAETYCIPRDMLRASWEAIGRKNMMLTIAGGTIAYMVMVQWIFS